MRAKSLIDQGFRFIQQALFMKQCSCLSWFGFAASCTFFLFINTTNKTYLVQAQIISDGTLPTPTKVTTQNSLDFIITNGSQVGNNLFHSFREFSIPTEGSAFFDNALDIQNIISRVTGGSISDIDGFIKTNGSTNLFLLNPNGIIFGSNASLNINGSFLTTTANSLLFEDGNQFSATADQTTPLLTVSIPSGLQLGNSTQPIYIQESNLQVATGREL